MLHTLAAEFSQKNIQSAFHEVTGFGFAHIQRRRVSDSHAVISKPLRMILINRCFMGTQTADPDRRTQSDFADFIVKCRHALRELCKINSTSTFVSHSETVRAFKFSRPGGVAVVNLHPLNGGEVFFDVFGGFKQLIGVDLAENTVIPGTPDHTVTVDIRLSVIRLKFFAQNSAVSIKNLFKIICFASRAEIPFIGQHFPGSKFAVVNGFERRENADGVSALVIVVKFVTMIKNFLGKCAVNKSVR